MICPNCLQEVSPVKIRGKKMRVVKKTNIRKRYIWKSKNEVLFCSPIPLVVVECVK